MPLNTKQMEILIAKGFSMKLLFGMQDRTSSARYFGRGEIPEVPLEVRR